MSTTAQELVDEALAAPTAGWDFAWLGDRMVAEPLPWDFGAIADAALAVVDAALDLGTGGGEFLVARRMPLPAITMATEAHPPNLRIAAQRLGAAGVQVVAVEPAVGNAVVAPQRRGRLPVGTASVDLVLCRHEAFAATEVARVLRPGGRFLTQQADSGTSQLRQLLDLPEAPAQVLDLDWLVAQVRDAGLTVDTAVSGVETVHFADVGALAWYLRMVPWALPGVRPSALQVQLVSAQGRDLTIHQQRYLLAAHR